MEVKCWWLRAPMRKPLSFGKTMNDLRVNKVTGLEVVLLR